MSLLDETTHALSDESDDSDTAAALAQLKAKVKQLEQRTLLKSQAIASLTALKNRYHKKEKLPTHPCGDILPYRYSSEAKVKLGQDKVTILVFAYLARYLSKSQIEALAAHGPTLCKATTLLAEEKGFHSSWFDCYLNWKKTNYQLAFEFFLGMANSLRFASDTNSF